MKPIDIAYEIGVRRALRDHEKRAATGDESSWWKPLLGAAGFGAGAYALARTPFKASLRKYPALRKIQEMAKGKMFRTDIQDLPPAATLWEKVKRSIGYGPGIYEEAIPKALKGTPKKPVAVWSGYHPTPPKGTFDPSLGPVTGAKARKAFARAEHLEDKLHQARFLEKHAPGSMARTMSLPGFLKKYNIELRRGKNLDKDLRRLQQALKKEFKGKYIIKSRAERAGGDIAATSWGKFPSDTTDLAKSYKQWLKMRPEFKRVARTDPVAAAESFSETRGFKGRVVEEMLHDNVVIQEKLPLKQLRRSLERYPSGKEYRIHFVGGKAMPLPSSRYGPAGVVANVGEMIGAQRAARWAQKNVLDKLPKKDRSLGYGLDVAALEGGGYKVIEMNPGGASGFLDFPIVGNPMLYKAVTGRHTPGISSLFGVGGAGTGGVAGAAID